MNNRKKLSTAERLIVYEKLNGHCAYCGQAVAYKDMQVDFYFEKEDEKVK